MMIRLAASAAGVTMRAKEGIMQFHLNGFKPGDTEIFDRSERTKNPMRPVRGVFGRIKDLQFGDQPFAQYGRRGR